MKLRTLADQLTSAFFILVSVGYILTARDYAPGARLIPTIVAVGTIIVATIQLIGPRVRFLQALAAEKEAAEQEADTFASNGYLKRGAVVVGWALLLHFLIYTLGFVVAVPFFMATFLSLVDRRSWILNLVMTVALGCLSYLLIVGLLQLPWNEGVIWSMID